jgi:hopanoid biosynthesis associated RND transporter like protein HpnN
MNIKPLTENNPVARVLSWLAGVICRHPRWFLYSQVLLFAFAVYYTRYNLEFDTSRNNLVGADKKYHQNFLKFRKEFPTQDDLVVVVESETPEKNRQFVERLGARLEAETNLFNNIFYKGDLKMLGSKALLLVPEPDLRELQRTLKDFRPFLERFSHTTNLVSLVNLINSQFRGAKREANAENESMIKALPALERIVRQATASLKRPGMPPSPGVTALFDAGKDAEQQIYVTFGEGRLYLVTAQAVKEELNGDAADRLRELVDEVQREVPGLTVGVTGEPILEIDEMKQSQKDTTLASIVALVLCSLIFIYGFQETGRPVKATICLVVGIGYTMGFATLTVGHLNILTITFVPILIGLAIDYGVHLISRYEEEVRHGASNEQALRIAMVYTGQGILTGGFTTAGAFLVMGFTNFRGIQEMGIICGGGLLVCLIPMLTLLPVLLLKGKQNVIDHKDGDALERRKRLENIWLSRPGTVVGIIVVLCALSVTQLPKVHFDYNLLHMQSADLPAVQVEEKLLKSTPKSVLYGAVIATNLANAVQLEQQLTNLPAVASVDSISLFLNDGQVRKLPLVDEIKKLIVPFGDPDPSPVKLEELSISLLSMYAYLDLAHIEVEKEEPELDKQLLSLRRAILELRLELLKGDEARQQATAARLGEFQRVLFNDVRDTFAALATQDTSSGPVRIEDMNPSLRNRFVGITGKYLLMVYPRKDVWQRENQKEFIDQVQTVYPDVTGTPVQLYYYTELLKSSYQEAAWYSLIAIVFLVVAHFRSLMSLFLAMLPVAVGFIWLTGFMGWAGVPFNPANIMILPLVIGIGVTNGIHILNRYAEEQTPSVLTRSTGKAVIVSGLTSIAGFGSLSLAEHRGIQSLGLVMSVGLATCMISGLTFVPALLSLFFGRKQASQSPAGKESPK